MDALAGYRNWNTYNSEVAQASISITWRIPYPFFACHAECLKQIRYIVNTEEEYRTTFRVHKGIHRVQFVGYSTNQDSREALCVILPLDHLLLTNAVSAIEACWTDTMAAILLNCWTLEFWGWTEHWKWSSVDAFISLVPQCWYALKQSGPTTFISVCRISQTQMNELGLHSFYIIGSIGTLVCLYLSMQFL